MRYLRYFFGLIIIVVGIMFAAFNAREVEVDYFFGTVNLFLPLLILLALIAGALLVYLILIPKVIRLRHHNNQLRRQLNEKQEPPLKETQSKRWRILAWRRRPTT